jgi:hypothetical protein
MALLLLGAAKEGTITVHISPGQPVGPESPVSPTSPAKIKVSPFQDGRTGMMDPYVIGRVALEFGTSFATIYSDLPVSEIVTEAVKSELMRKGYRIVQGNEDLSIKGKIVQFLAKPTYKLATAWDIAGGIAFTMEVNWPGQKAFSTLGPYNGQKVERRAINPNREKIKRAMEGALMEAIQAMGSDPNLTKELSKKQKN